MKDNKSTIIHNFKTMNKKLILAGSNLISEENLVEEKEVVKIGNMRKKLTKDKIKEDLNTFWLGQSKKSQFKNKFKIKNKHILFEDWVGELEPYITKEKERKEGGLKIILKGRLRGAAKRRKLVSSKGNLKSQTIDKNIEFTKKGIYTKWGIMGLRIYKRNK